MAFRHHQVHKLKADAKRTGENLKRRYGWRYRVRPLHRGRGLKPLWDLFIDKSLRRGWTYGG